MTEQQREAILSAIKEIDAIAARNAGHFPVDAPGQPEIHELCGKVELALDALSHAEVEAVEPADTQILEIAQNPMVTPCLPWWLKDDVNAGDVQTAAIAFARAVLRKFGSYPAPQVAGLTETAIKSSPAYRALHREKEHLLGLLKDQAPQVAVPEGWKLVPVEPTDKMMLRGGFSFAGKMPNELVYPAVREVWDRLLSEVPDAPTAPAGEPEKPRINVGSVGHVEEPVSDPDGLPDRVLMPRALTAENGAKTALMGEFDFSVTMTCPECHPDDPNPDCEVCSGSVEYEQPHTVPWTTIKRIYTAAVDLLSAPAPDEREIAAKALDRHVAHLQAMGERDARNNDHEGLQTWEDAVYFARQEAARLRAGKGDE